MSTTNNRLTITLLHGFMGDPSDWDGIRSELTDFDIVTPTIRPAASWAAGIQQLLDELPAHSVLVGYSLGARLALACALEAPERCAALVLVSGNPGLDGVERLNRLRHDTLLADRLETEPRREFLEKWYQQAIWRSLPPERIREEIERKLARSGQDWGAILRTYSVAQQPNYWSRLAEFPRPILAIAGQRDEKYVEIVLKISTFANGQARIIPSAGHMVHREQPHVFAQTLRGFLSQLHHPIATVV